MNSSKNLHVALAVGILILAASISAHAQPATSAAAAGTVGKPAVLAKSGSSANAANPGSKQTPADSPRERLSLDGNWKFHLGDIPFPIITGHLESYNNAKAGTARGAAAMDYNDADWRKLDLPHDWSIELPVAETNNLAQGFRTRGIAWYRRSFTLDPSDMSKNLELQFDGVATFCTVWVNGSVMHRNWCGYTSFTVDITPVARFEAERNTIAVRVDADAQEGWWYEGAGIYRHTWLVKRNPVHIATDGIFANPIRQPDGKWIIPVEVTLGNTGVESAAVELESTVIDPAGKPVARGGAKQVVAPFESPVAAYSIAVASPDLWSVEHPPLYKVRTTVKSGDRLLDESVTTCGFRTIRFDADKGFFLNDRPVKIKGTCNHQDHAGVGVAVPDSLWDFRVRRLKEMGANANRCSHNPPSAEFLDACDRQGLLVMDENRNFNTSEEYKRQLQWLVRRDRNHPSVILWSVFNEEPMQGTRQAYEMVRTMSAVVKQLDRTRPVTAAQSDAMMNEWNASKAADVAGYNYQHGGYDSYHKANPTKPMTSSEDTSAVMTRGEYTTDRARSILGSYDTEWQSWGLSHRAAWREIATRPFLAGGFVWTGFDYHGEPQPLGWPATASSFGCMDLCGFPKTAYYIHQAQWIEDRPVLQLVPHWNWPGKEDKPIPVMVISNADKVRLILNGKTVGEQPVDKYAMNQMEVAYQPGKLEAISFKDGKEVARCSVETTGDLVALRLVPDRQGLAGDGRDAQPVTVQAVDAQGRPVPIAHDLVSFKITGPGRIIGVGNGDPLCHEAEKLIPNAVAQTDSGYQRSLFNGLAQVIIQSDRNAQGTIRLEAAAGGLKPATVEIKVQHAEMEAGLVDMDMNRAFGPTVLVDELGDFSHIDSDSGEWGVTAGLPDRTALIRKRNTDQFIVYKQPNVSGFIATIYFTPFLSGFTNDDINVSVSSNGSDWTSVDVEKGERTDIPKYYPYQQNTLKNINKLPPGSNYIKFEVPPAKDSNGTEMPDGEAWRVCLGRIELFSDAK